MKVARPQDFTGGYEPPENGSKGRGTWTLKADGWEVLAFAGLVWIAVCALVDDLRDYLWIGFVLLVLWVVTVFLTNLGVLRPRKPADGGGATPKN
jgi:hypothetical protein